MIRNSVIFCTTCALSGLTLAQSSATIYGLVDLSIQNVRSGDESAMKGGSLTRLADGTIYGPGSRWGIRVNEDLGSGFKAFTVLESGFFADTGTTAQGGRGFGRTSFIGLSSISIGELRLGRQYILHDETMFQTTPTAGATALNPGGIYTLPAGTLSPYIDAPRLDNAIHYISPFWNGLRLQAMFGLSEKVQDRYQGIKGSYVDGPWTVVTVYEQSKPNITPANGSSSVNKIFQAGAVYNFGPFSLYGSFQNGKELTTGAGTQLGTLTVPTLSRPVTKFEARSVGASSLITPTTNAFVIYTRTRLTDNTGADTVLGRAGVGATYFLSKTASIYGAVAFATGDLKNYVNEKQVYQVGLRKSF